MDVNLNVPIPVTELMKILPHRYPFLLIDKITAMNRAFSDNSHVGSTVTAIKNVTMNEPYFQGHFPGMPIMPGVMIIEAMAQSAAILSYRPKPDGGGWTYLIASIDNVKFRRPVVPGDQLIINCEMIKDRKTLFMFRCEAKVDGQLAAEAEIMAKMV